MMPYHFEIKSGKRGTSVSHINYIARDGKHAERNDLVATEHGNLPRWAENNPVTFFKASDQYERKNGAAYRSMIFNLPKVLNPQQNIRLASNIARALATDKPYLLAVHANTSALSGESHPHCHLMVSDRLPDGIERTPEQTFSRYNAKHPEKGGCKKDSGGKNRMEQRDWVIEQRKIVADHINDALAKNGFTERADHRSFRARGIKQKPEAYLGPARVRQMSDEDKKAILRARRQPYAMHTPWT